MPKSESLVAPKGKTRELSLTALKKTAAGKKGAAKSKAVEIVDPLRPKGASAIWGTVDFPVKRHFGPHGQVTAVSMMKDEGPFVIEWIAHHLAVGFSDLVVFTNDCSDGTDDMLIRLEELGLCHHRRNVISDGIRPQPSALTHAELDPVVIQSDWVMVFDADEFLSIRYGDGTLDPMLDATVEQGANGVVVTWRIFGSGGVVDWSRAPVTEQYLMAAPASWNKGWGVKTLFKFDVDKWKLGIHRPKLKAKVIETDFPDQVKWLNGSGKVMEDYFKFRGWRSIQRTVGYDWVQLNHYAVKSVDSYAIRKMRGNVNNKADKYNSDYWSLQDRNEVRDDTMLRYSEARSRLMGQLLQDPVLAKLHLAAVDRAEARLAELRKTEAYHTLVADLARASMVPITQIVAKPPQARDKEKIAALMSEVEKMRNAKAKVERLAGPKEVAAPTVPLGSYCPEPIDLSRDANVALYPNRSMKLPGDFRIFAAHVMPLIEAGKFQRAMARKLPKVLQRNARVLEIGAGVGFLSGHLANERPDLDITMQEDSPGLQQMMPVICEISDRPFDNRFRLLDFPLDPDVTNRTVALVDQVKPTVLILGDARISDAVLRSVLGSNDIEQLFLYDRMIEANHASMDSLIQSILSFGFQAEDGMEMNSARGFRRVAKNTE